ncbi:MAG TPA: bifunctional riboflavin kinase/FAD synthetase, partial [Acidimicrobiales bacterium]|nr:bifunctional riboflavin kinase/FAD synthetase [Acidimicrobiales bacterium]
MEVHADPASLGRPLLRSGPAGRPTGTAVTIGAYDGVHLGHQAVLRELRTLAAARGLPTVVLTFDRHPASVVRPESAPRLLTDLDQKLELLAAVGDVDHAVILHFDEARSQEEAADFVADVLVGALGARLVVVGEDFHFGRGRRGNVELLRNLGTTLGFEVVGLALQTGPGIAAPVSSTAVRRALTRGAVDEAAIYLGRPHEVRGTVVRGDRRGGSLLGFPTANVAVAPEILLPADGIYAGWFVRPDGERRAAALSVGRRPTFTPDAETSVLEAYLLDFDGDLYGEAAKVQFVRRLRDETRFDSVDELVAQMKADVEATRDVLASSAFGHAAGTAFGHAAGTAFGHAAGTAFGHAAGTAFGHAAGTAFGHAAGTA